MGETDVQKLGRLTDRTGERESRKTTRELTMYLKRRGKLRRGESEREVAVVILNSVND